MRRIPSRSACHFVSSAGHRRGPNSPDEMFGYMSSRFQASVYLNHGLGKPIVGIRSVIRKKAKGKELVREPVQRRHEAALDEVHAQFLRRRSYELSNKLL
jgi:hypothetical protein